VPQLELDGLFRCEYFAKDLTHRACLRRQLERQESTKAGVAGPPVKPHCAERCEQGRAVRAGLAHVPARTCTACGTALIPGHLAGNDPAAPCPVCEARSREARGAPPATRTPSRVPVSTRIWEPQPEVPFATPKPSPAAPTAAPPAPTTAAEETPAPTPDAPSAAAPKPEETDMRKRTLCPECGSPSKYKAGCSRPSKTAPPAKPKPEKKLAAPKPLTLAPKPPSADLSAVSDEDLVQAIEDARAELARRQADAEARAAKLKAALERVDSAREHAA
jgi:hypothetical protein